MRRSLREWALNVREGLTYEDPGQQDVDFEWATLPRPSYRTRQAMQRYMQATNARRYARLQGDYAWARKCMEKMGLNPDDAIFLLDR